MVACGSSGAGGIFRVGDFLGVSVAGVANASWLWPVVGAMALLLIGWERYSELFAKAGKVRCRLP
jgi:hypothetical protein